MKEKVLGLDLGIASIGWAISSGRLQKEENILDYGVRIFSPGMAKGEKRYKSRSEERRTKRSMRRMFNRRLRRKLGVLTVLVDENMCPLSKDELSCWKRMAKGKKGSFPQSEDFIAWLRLDPYELRSKAVEEKLSSELLGRAIYHMAQRRGFKSNRKDTEKQKGKDEEIDEALSQQMIEYGVKSLGQLLYKKKKDGNAVRLKRSGDDFSVNSSRISYENEFKLIVEAQGFKKELGERLYKALFFQRPLKSQKHLVGKCVLEPKRTRCPISAIECEEFTLYTTLNNIYITEQDGAKKRALSLEEKELVIPCFLRAKRSFTASDITKKLQKNLKNKELRINYRDKQSLSNCPTMSIFFRIWGSDWKKNLHTAYKENSKNAAYKSEADSVHDVWHVLFSFENEDNLRSWGKERLGLMDEKLEIFAKAQLKDGYSKLSRNALRKIVPLLKEGFRYHEAVQLGNLKEVFGNAGQAQRWQDEKEEILRAVYNELERLNKERAIVIEENSKIKAEREEAYDSKRNAYKREDYDIPSFSRNFEKTPSIGHGLKMFLESEYSISQSICAKKLYHHSAIDTFPEVKKGSDKLGSPECSAIRNPLVNRALHEVRRLINCLISENKIERDTQVIVEMANEVNDNNTRSAIERFQMERKKERDNAKERITEYLGNQGSNRIPSEDEILRYILWEEQEQKCLYTGKQLGIAEVFDGNSTDFEHTFPLSRSRDDSRINKTLCDGKFNRQRKKDFHPKELYENGVLDENVMKERLKPWAEKIDALKDRIEKLKGVSKSASTREKKDSAISQKNYLIMELKYWKGKYDSFFTDMPKGFTSRNLVDTRIISKYAKEFLKSYFKHVYTARGSQVSEFRKKILNLEELSSQLSFEGREENLEKDRHNHSHHMIDALALCFLEPFLLQKQNSDWALRDYYVFLGQLHKDDNIDKEHLARTQKELLDWKGTFPVREFMKHLQKNLLVSHEQRMNRELWFLGKDMVRGVLHKESVYGKIKRPQQGTKKTQGDAQWKYLFVKRESLDEILKKPEKSEKIVDSTLRDEVSKLIEESGSRLDEAKKNGEFSFYDAKRQKHTVRKLRIINKGEPIPIKAHQMIGKNTKQNKHEYKHYLYMKLGNNHHVQILHNEQGKPYENIVSFWKIVERHKKGEDVFAPAPKGHSLIQTLQIGRLYLIGLKEEHSGWENWSSKQQAQQLNNHLYRVTKLSSVYYCLVRHNVADEFSKLEKEKQTKSKFDYAEGSSPEGLRITNLKNVENMLEVSISPSGRLSRCKDLSD